MVGLGNYGGGAYLIGSGVDNVSGSRSGSYNRQGAGFASDLAGFVNPSLGTSLGGSKNAAYAGAAGGLLGGISGSGGGLGGQGGVAGSGYGASAGSGGGVGGLTGSVLGGGFGGGGGGGGGLGGLGGLLGGGGGGGMGGGLLGGLLGGGGTRTSAAPASAPQPIQTAQQGQTQGVPIADASTVTPTPMLAGTAQLDPRIARLLLGSQGAYA